MRDSGCLGCLNAFLFKQEKVATDHNEAGKDLSGTAGTAAITTKTTTDNFFYRSANVMFDKDQATTNDNEANKVQASAVGTAATTTKSRTKNFFFRS
jgi:hypothetical protein